MSAPLIVVPFAIEITVLITTVAPIVLPGRFNRTPNLGIAIWFLCFLLAFVSTGVALVVSIWSIFDTWLALEANVQPLWHVILFSFAPWIILGLAGISMALIAQKLDPLREGLKADANALPLPSNPLMNFHGVRVRLVDLPLWLAFTKGIGRRSTIYVSSLVQKQLSPTEFEALLWHERAHAVRWHNALKFTVLLIRQLGGIVLASRVLAEEIDRLCELSADASAARVVGEQIVSQARTRFD